MAASFANADNSFFNETGGQPSRTVVPTTGNTITMKSGQRVLYVNPAGTLATLTIKLPLDIQPGEKVVLTFSQIITALTVKDGFAVTVSGGPGAAAAGGTYVLRYPSKAIGWVASAEETGTTTLGSLGLTATAAEINVLHSVTPGAASASSVAVLGANKNLDTLVLPVSGLKIGPTAGTAVTASAAELNVLTGVTPGTAAASKAAVLGANKNLDTLVLPAGGLYIGATAGTQVTPTAAELNILASVTPGTAAASKAAVLGSNKNLDTLVVADGGLKLGAAGGTAIGATAAEINNAADVSARVQGLTASGAVTAGVQSVELAHGTVVIAATIDDAANHPGLFHAKDTSASGTAAHTLTLTSGTWNGTNNVATFDAPGEAIVVYFDSAGNGTLIANVGAVAFS